MQSGRASTVFSVHPEYLPGSSGLLSFGLFSGPIFWKLGFACPTYCIPQSELGALSFQSDPDFSPLFSFSLSVLSLTVGLFPFLSFPAICSCLWHHSCSLPFFNHISHFFFYKPHPHFLFLLLSFCYLIHDYITIKDLEDFTNSPKSVVILESWSGFLLDKLSLS